MRIRRLALVLAGGALVLGSTVTSGQDARDEHFFDFKKGDYVFSFSPSDDFSGVKILNGGRELTGREIEEYKKGNHGALPTVAEDRAAGWHLTADHAYVGDYVMRFTGSSERPTSGWLFSRGFVFEAGQTYYAGIYYASKDAALDKVEAGGLLPGRSTNKLRLRLRLGRRQHPEAMKQDLFDVGVASPDYQLIKVPFRVEESGVYFFSLEAEAPALAGSIDVGLNAAGTGQDLAKALVGF